METTETNGSVCRQRALEDLLTEISGGSILSQIREQTGVSVWQLSLPRKRLAMMLAVSREFGFYDKMVEGIHFINRMSRKHDRANTFNNSIFGGRARKEFRKKFFGKEFSFEGSHFFRKGGKIRVDGRVIFSGTFENYKEYYKVRISLIEEGEEPWPLDGYNDMLQYIEEGILQIFKGVEKTN